MHLTTNRVLVMAPLTSFTVNHHRR